MNNYPWKDKEEEINDCQTGLKSTQDTTLFSGLFFGQKGAPKGLGAEMEVRLRSLHFCLKPAALIDQFTMGVSK